jgi:hypothetical protein
MKNLISLGLVAIMALTVMVSSCNKYPEGPKITFLSAKARISGDWKMTKYTINGADYTSSFGTQTMTIEKDGTYSSTYTSGSFSITSTGTWAFNGDKTTISFTETGESSAEIFTILELRNKQLMLQQVVDGDTYITTYTAQ